MTEFVDDTAFREAFRATYPDLALRTPDCPVCGQGGAVMMGGNLYPMGFCQVDGCPSFSWDPTADYREDEKVQEAKATYMADLVLRFLRGEIPG